jgi:thiol-disulfide isomerase/thioredoxin
MPNRRVLTILLTATLASVLARAGVASASVASPPAATPPAATSEASRPNLVRLVRLKLSAADLASAEAWTEDWKRDFGADATWLDARAWLARGAWMLGEHDRALAFAREVRAAISEPKPELLIPLGAALEVEGRVLAEREGASSGARFFRAAEKLSSDAAFRARMWKNVNRLELVGQAAPPLGVTDHVGSQPPTLAALGGRPALLFFWNYRCGDCEASAPTLVALHERYAKNGLVILAPTRYYGQKSDGSAATPEEEKAEIARELAGPYAGLADLAAPIDTDTSIRYGASATPTFVLIDREGIVRLYAPTRLTLAALSAAIEPLLAASPSSGGTEGTSAE